MGRAYRNTVEHLLVHNQGRIPTFESKNGKSIIDVTLSHRLPYTLENWRVLRSYNGTDHNTIHYSLKGCLLYTSPSPRDQRGSRMPSSA